MEPFHRIDDQREEHRISLSSHMVRASVAVTDIARAAEFYEQRLGLVAVEEQSDQSRIYPCGGGSSLHVYESPTQASRGSATVATWYVADLDDVVADLDSRGVAFERYDDPALSADENGIHELDDGRVVWFRDPDGNTFAIEERSVQ
jgi:catechol 2,3-dioxygenase-like lactoylglutathione lyase family enzyme